MKILLALFYEFFKAGLFAVGGGLATLPFLYDIAARYDWLPVEMMPDMIAVSESTPGPIGINMATYAGFNAYGVLGGIVATCSLVLPSVIIIILISKFLNRFNENPLVKNAFTGLRPAVTGLIAAAGWQVFSLSILEFSLYEQTKSLLFLIDWKALGLFIILWVTERKFKGHPLFYIAGAAAAGILLGF
ncbi:MAG: chromate transporter [Provencibacterium sp.]|jgi:chromate transporter|nr:chromate transporter [Provencibacterium sp.]